MSAMNAEPSASPRGGELAALWMMPFTLGMTILESWASVSDAWLQMLFSPERHHDHDSHADLEVPDPIEDDGEHDLFA